MGAGGRPDLRAIAAVGRGSDDVRPELGRAQRAAIAVRDRARVCGHRAIRLDAAGLDDRHRQPDRGRGKRRPRRSDRCGCDARLEGTAGGPSRAAQPVAGGRGGVDSRHRSRRIEPVCAPAPVAVEGRRFAASDRRWRCDTPALQRDLFTGATGHELLVAQTNVEARLDRPVDVKGTPFRSVLASPCSRSPTRTPSSWRSSTTTTFSSTASIPQASWPVEPRAAPSRWPFATRCSPSRRSTACCCSRELRDEETVGRRRSCSAWACTACCRPCPIPMRPMSAGCAGRAGGRSALARPAMLLVGAVTWEKAAGRGRRRTPCRRSSPSRRSGTPRRRFQVDEAGTRQGELAAAVLNADVPGAAASHRCAERLPQSNQRDWDRLFQPFENEQFALLDVSSQRGPDGSELRLVHPACSEATMTARSIRVYQPKAGRSAAAFPLQVQRSRTVRRGPLSCGPSPCRRSAGNRCST